MPDKYELAFQVNERLEIHPAALIMPEMTPEEFDLLKVDISGNGLIEPLVLFQNKVLDGRHRYKACEELGIDVWAREWEGGMNPVEYVISMNFHRRHLTTSQRAMVAANASEYHVNEARERQRAAGGDHGNQHTGGKVAVPANLREPTDDKKPFASNKHDNESASKAGKQFNVSGRTVASAQTILKHGTEYEIESVRSGRATVHAVEQQVKERIKEIHQTDDSTPSKKYIFNKTNESIEWAKWTWNPVTGCKYGCPYCYARDMGNRFNGGFEPAFHPEKLSAPANTKVPIDATNGNRNVFVCSMAELFGDWVPQEWIDQVIESCTKAPEWTFIFLTKNPKRLIGIEWPENAWVGTTVDCQARVNPAVDAFKELNEHQFRPVVTFLSCEPMNESLDFGERGLHYFDWVIIGGRSASSGAPSFQPEWDWVERLHNSARAAGCKIYWKPNLKTRPTEYPV